MYDIEKHVKSGKHQKTATTIATSSSIASFCARPTDQDLSQIKAEVLHVLALVDSNTPFATTDVFNRTFKVMFPDSAIARSFSCGRTKATAITKTLAQDRTDTLVEALKNGPFSVSTDGSNDDYKLYPIVVRYFNSEVGKISTSLLALPCLKGDSTGVNIANLIISEFSKKSIPWENCISFSTDNAPVMVGRTSGCAIFLKKKHSELAVIGCPNNLLALAGQNAANTLPIDAEELLIYIFYHLDKSVKRKQTFKEFQQLHNVASHKILKHMHTRWLSLGSCLQRIIEQWDPLKDFFTAENSGR